MIDGLACRRAGIDHRPKTLRLKVSILRDFSNRKQQGTQKIAFGRWGFREGGNMLFRNDENMHGSLGTDILKREQEIILKNNPSWNIFVYDPAK